MKTLLFLLLIATFSAAHGQIISYDKPNSTLKTVLIFDNDSEVNAAIGIYRQSDSVRLIWNLYTLDFGDSITFKPLAFPVDYTDIQLIMDAELKRFNDRFNSQVIFKQ